ncbi:GerAB/ArcD/ProY family transporter [Clostridium sp. 'White wine YQ']|uniref:GerAB/ArcD/ProY family transporter n=1 Tax=Clostridium sp. 'White wine YQ' TaxID=3027474 RepID=UPI0023662A84|nr:endospore germination permease [Clostridium sp. 'White wine YQ']MDD7792876.1 endospore germination permease [Clostridium sp. 'White wine YQ']
MNKETLSNTQAICTMNLFLMGSTLLLGAGGQAKNDNWISIILAILLVIPITYVYSKIISLFPDKNIFDIFNILFGKVIAKLLTAIYTWYFFHLGVLVLRNFGEFLTTQAMPETPMLVPIITLTLLCIWAVKSGLEAVGRSSKILFLTCIVVIVIIQFLALSKESLPNIKPILKNGWNPVLSGAFSAFSFPFAEIIAFIGLPYFYKEKVKPFKVLLISILGSGLLILVIAFRNILVLGPNNLTNTYFPSYIAVSRIHVGDFLQRIEVSVSITFVSSVFIKISICLMAASNGLKALFGLSSYKTIVFQLGLLMAYFSYFIYGNIMQMVFWALNIYQYYAFPFQVIIPILVLLVAEKKKSKLITNN